MTKEEIAVYFCKRLGRVEGTPEWKSDYERFLSWSLRKLEDQYKYVRDIHTTGRVIK